MRKWEDDAASSLPSDRLESLPHSRFALEARLGYWTSDDHRHVPGPFFGKRTRIEIVAESGFLELHFVLSCLWQGQRVNEVRSRWGV